MLISLESRYTYCYFEMGKYLEAGIYLDLTYWFSLGDQVFVTKPAEHHGKPVWREYFIL